MRDSETGRTALDVDVPVEGRSENQVMTQLIMASLFAQDFIVPTKVQRYHTHQQRKMPSIVSSTHTSDLGVNTACWAIFRRAAQTDTCTMMNLLEGIE